MNESRLNMTEPGAEQRVRDNGPWRDDDKAIYVGDSVHTLTWCCKRSELMAAAEAYAKAERAYGYRLGMFVPSGALSGRSAALVAHARFVELLGFDE